VLALIILAAAGTLIAGIQVIAFDRPAQTAPVNGEPDGTIGDCSVIRATCLEQFQPRVQSYADQVCGEIAMNCVNFYSEWSYTTDKESLLQDWNDYIYQKNHIYHMNL
jgi:hypothetical protein